MDWITATNRFIAFFDIMGFKDYVFRNSHADVEKMLFKLHNIITEVNNDKYKDEEEKMESDIKVSIFSDSILVITNDTSSASAYHITMACSYILSQCIRETIPIKGAISYGMVTADFDKSIFFGQALIDAYSLQDQLHMYGCAVDDKCEAKFEELKFNDDFLQEEKVPFKGGLIRHFALNWKKISLLDSNIDGITKQLKAFYHSVSGNTRKYVDNTIEFVAKLEGEFKLHIGQKKS